LSSWFFRVNVTLWPAIELTLALACTGVLALVSRAARDDAALVLARDPDLTTPRGEALRHLLYLFERDAAVKTLRAA